MEALHSAKKNEGVSGARFKHQCEKAHFEQGSVTYNIRAALHNLIVCKRALSPQSGTWNRLLINRHGVDCDP